MKIETLPPPSTTNAARRHWKKSLALLLIVLLAGGGWYAMRARGTAKPAAAEEKAGKDGPKGATPAKSP